MICIDELNLKNMRKLRGRKVSGYAFAEFASVLEREALKNNCTGIKADRWLPSGKAAAVI